MSSSSDLYRPLEVDPRFAGLQLLGCAVVIIDRAGLCLFLNDAAEQLFQVSPRVAIGFPYTRVFGLDSPIDGILETARKQTYSQRTQDIDLERPHRAITLHLHVTAVPSEEDDGTVLLECREIDQRLRVDREVQLLETADANRELVRNLAHEIKNPLGGIRGAAQLLESELPGDGLREYTQVIIKEADRLQMLVDRLLAPHRLARKKVAVNIHEVCERVRSVLNAEFPTLTIIRDYDASLPEFPGDREQLIQAVLNLGRNAAQALKGKGEIQLRTRVARQVMIARRKCRLALDLHVIDNGPGIPEAIRDRIFFPLVTGRDGGSGLGLSLAQTFVQQHGGVIECESRPGCTDFRVLLPLS